LKIDFHIHSRHSGDAGLKPEQIIGLSKEKGIIPALTDHNTCDGWKETKKQSKSQKWPFIQGEEIKVYSGSNYLGELLGLFMQNPVKKGQLWDVLDALEEQDAFISVPHPFDYLRKPLLYSFKALDEIVSEVHAVEVFNSRCRFNFPNKLAERYAAEHGKPFTAGSDAHFPVELGNAYVEVEASDLEEARKKILKRKCSFSGKISPWKVHNYTTLVKLGLMK